jgi:hypothetical protein
MISRAPVRAWRVYAPLFYQLGPSPCVLTGCTIVGGEMKLVVKFVM